MFGPYVRVLRARGVFLPLCASFLGALPLGIVSVGVIFLIQSVSDSFGSAGVVAGAFNGGNALGLLIQGRLLDRISPPRILIPAGIGCFAFLIILTLSAVAGLPLTVLAAVAFVAGGLVPAVLSCMRAALPDLVSAPADRAAAYALLSILFQIAMILGPLTTSAFLLLGGPAISVVAAGALAAAASILFSMTSASKRSRGDVQAAARPKVLTPGTWTVLVASGLGGIATGIFLVGVPVTAVALGSSALVGPLLASMSVGEFVGGLAYGAIPWRRPVRQRLVIAQLGVAVGMAGLALTFRWLVPVIVVLFALGAIQAQSGISVSVALDDIASRAVLTQLFTSVIAISLAGMSLGNVIGGLIEKPDIAFAAAAGAAASVAVWTLRRSTTLSPPATDATPARTT